MRMRVLIIPDKFKGTLTAAAAAKAIARGWRKGRPQDLLDLLPMSDGGDGFGFARRLAKRGKEGLTESHRPRLFPEAQPPAQDVLV